MLGQSNGVSHPENENFVSVQVLVNARALNENDF